MPYTTVCTIIPDDGKIHDPRRIGDTTKSVCGKTIKELKRSGSGSKMYTIQQSCTDCWPCFKEYLKIKCS